MKSCQGTYGSCTLQAGFANVPVSLLLVEHGPYSVFIHIDSKFVQ